MPSVATGSVEVFGFDQTILCSEELIRLYLEGELGMSIFSKEMTATGGLRMKGFAKEKWPFYPDVLRTKVARFDMQLFESVLNG